MRAVPFIDVPADVWNEVASISDEAWLFHRAEWVRIETLFFVEENHSFAIENGGEIVGIQPLYLASASQTGAERLLCSGIHRHTGLALVPHLAQREAAQNVAMERIFSIAAALDVDRIALNVHNLAPICFTTRRPEIPFWMADYGFHLGLNFGPSGQVPFPGMTAVAADQIVDLRATEQQLFSGVDRTAIRKGQKSGLSLRVSHAITELDAYYALAGLSAKRTGEPLPPIDFYRAILAALAPEGHAGFAFASLGTNNVAAIFFLADKRSINYMAGVSDPAHLNASPNDFVHWELMMWAKAQGFERYRLGPIFPEVPASWPIARVSKFKSKFGGRSYTTIQGSLFRHPALYRDAALSAIEARYAPPVADT
jgi:hypothetical protein